MSRPELSTKKPSSYKLIAASSASRWGTDAKLSGEGRVFEKGDGKRFFAVGRFDGLEEGKSHIIRQEYFLPNGKHRATYTFVIPASQKRLWAWLRVRLDKKYERHLPSGLWKVKFFVNDHYIDTLHAVLHRKDEDPSRYLRLLREKDKREDTLPHLRLLRKKDEISSYDGIWKGVMSCGSCPNCIGPIKKTVRIVVKRSRFNLFDDNAYDGAGKIDDKGNMTIAWKQRGRWLKYRIFRFDGNFRAGKFKLHGQRGPRVCDIILVRAP